jgi:DNA-binding response OmpR family regulator
MKKILIIEEDRMIANFYRERFESSGFSVETARNGENGIKAVESRKPDLVLIDPVLSSLDGAEVIRQIRSKDESRDLPILVFTNTQPSVAQAVQQAGASRVVPSTPDKAERVLSEVRSALGIDGEENAAGSGLAQDGAEFWLKSSIEATPAALASMRTCLHTFIKNQNDLNPLSELYRQVHAMSERTAVVGLRAMHKLTAALENLVFDLYKNPSRVNSSSLHTASQCIDFLGVLLDAKNLVHAHDHTLRNVFAVDDDTDVQRVIGAAMEMVDLKITCAAEPMEALERLKDFEAHLIFLDVGLPSMSGFELCKQIRLIPAHQKTPVVFLTGLATFQNRVQSNLSGGNDFIGKPFNLSELGVKALTWVLKHQLGMV